MKKLVVILVESNLWISAGLASLVYPAAYLIDISISWKVAVLGFFVTLAIYTWDHRNDVLKSEWQPSDLMAYYYKSNYALVVITFSLMAVYFILLSAPFLAVIGCLFVILFGFLYSSRILINPSGRTFRLKDWGGAKAWIVALLVALSAVMAPILFLNNFSNLSYFKILLATCYFFSMLVCNAHMFDIRDRKMDLTLKINTLPIKIGPKKTIYLLHAVNLLGGIFIFILGCSPNGAPHGEMMLWVFGNLLYLIFLKAGNKHRLYYDLMVDGSLFLPAIAVYVKHFTL